MQMSSHILTLITASAVTAILSYGVSTAAQTPAPQPLSQVSPSSPIQGELIEVDPVKMTLTIINEKESKETFIYTNTTQVTNAAQSPTPVAGLATMKNARVTVHFEEKAGVKTATRIEVRPAAPNPPR